LDYTILATGSEVALALDVAKERESQGYSTRVVSVPSFELFEAQPKSYQNMVLGSPKQSWVIEAQSSFGWHKFIGREGFSVTMDRFGISAKDKDLANEFGFTVEKIVKKMESVAEVSVR